MRTVLTMAKRAKSIISDMAHCVYHIYTVLKVFEITVCFAHFTFFEICTAVMRNVLAMANRV